MPISAIAQRLHAFVNYVVEYLKGDEISKTSSILGKNLMRLAITNTSYELGDSYHAVGWNLRSLARVTVFPVCLITNNPR